MRKWFNKQAYLYKYPENGIKDTPVKQNDDGYDCLRYALYTWLLPTNTSIATNSGVKFEMF